MSTTVSCCRRAAQQRSSGERGFPRPVPAAPLSRRDLPAPVKSRCSFTPPVVSRATNSNVDSGGCRQQRFGAAFPQTSRETAINAVSATAGAGAAKNSG